MGADRIRLNGWAHFSWGEWSIGTGQYYFSSSLTDLLVGAFACIGIGPGCGLCRRSGPLGFARQFALWGGSAFSGRGGYLGRGRGVMQGWAGLMGLISTFVGFLIISRRETGY